MKKLIVFVCNGNIHRSAIAEKYLAKVLKELDLSSKYSVASCGLQGTQGAAKPRYRNLTEYKEEWEAAKPTLDKFALTP